MPSVREAYQVRFPISREAYEDLDAGIWEAEFVIRAKETLEKEGHDWADFHLVRREDYAWVGEGDEMTLTPTGPDTIQSLFGDCPPATNYVFVYEAMGVRNA